MYFQRGKNPLTLILILVLTFNKRRCAKTKTKNDYIDIKIRSQIGLCSWPINTLHNNIWTATFFLKIPQTQLSSRFSTCLLLSTAKSLYSRRVAATCVKQVFWKYLPKYLFFTAAHLYACTYFI